MTIDLLVAQKERSCPLKRITASSPDCTTSEEDTESDSESEHPSDISSHHYPGNQTNNSTVQNPTGPTTVLVNSVPSTPVLEHAAPNDLVSTPVFPPVQPTNIKYPTTVISGRSRSFNPKWYTLYPWLEYSVQQDACFCYSCRLFGTGAGTKGERTFTVSGFKDWKHATGKDSTNKGNFLEILNLGAQVMIQ